MTEVPANPEALLAETAWLRRIAGELARDSSGADDLTQETMLAALRQPAPSHASMRTWLESIARRLNARFHRSTYHRDQRERKAARPEVVDSAAQMFDQFTLHRDVVQAVMGLNEPLRSTVLMRFWEGLPPRKIASRLDVPVETVRSRLKLGLAKLRRKLDRDYGKRDAWVVPLLALPIPHGTSITSISLGAMVMIMQKKAALSLVAAALVLISGGVWWNRIAAALPSEQLADAPSLPAPVELAVGQATTLESKKVTRTEVAVEPKWIEGIVIDENGAPIADVEVFLIAESKMPGNQAKWVNFEPAEREIFRVVDTLLHIGMNRRLSNISQAKWLAAEQVTQSDEQGHFRFRRVASDEARFVGLWSPEWGCRYQPYSDASSIEVLCETWPRISGRVLTVDGQEVPDQKINVRIKVVPILNLTTDESGAFQSPGLPPSLSPLSPSFKSYEVQMDWFGPHELEDRDKHEFELTGDRVVDVTLHPVSPFHIILVDENDQPWTGERLKQQGWSFENNMQEAERTQRWPLFFSLGKGSIFDETLRLDFDPETGALEGFQPEDGYTMLLIDQPVGPFKLNRSFSLEGRQRIKVIFSKVRPIEMVVGVR